jgi:cob(I)alamin adenosyltransferase
LTATAQRHSERGLVHIFTGDGKGKTSAALGMALRALGHGWRVSIISFMKGDYPYGEFHALSQLPNVTVARFGLATFCDPANVKPEEKEQAGQALAKAREVVLGGSYDLVVLDEVNVAAAWKLVEPDDVVRLIAEKPPAVSLVLTGRYADTRLAKLADQVTEMLNIKHPFAAGVAARKGIEY